MCPPRRRYQTWPPGRRVKLFAENHREKRCNRLATLMPRLLGRALRCSGSHNGTGKFFAALSQRRRIMDNSTVQGGQPMKRMLAMFTVLAVWVALAAPPGAAPNTLTAKEKAEGWILLFDGKTLDNWDPNTNPNGAWKVVDGTIMTDSPRGTTLLTKEDFANFELRLEFRTTDNVNSGVMLRNPRPHPAPPGEAKGKKKGGG